MTSWARPGVKVVCVDAEPDNGKVWRSGDAPIVGNIYEIASSVFVGPKSGKLVAMFKGHPVRLRISRFRPLVTKTQDQDVAMFRHLLTKQGVDA